MEVIKGVLSRMKQHHSACGQSRLMCLLLTCSLRIMHHSDAQVWRRVIRSVWRQHTALAHLPGPVTSNPLGYVEMLISKEPHRLLLDLAERYGPIYKFRLLHLHVGSLIISPDHQSAVGCMLIPCAKAQCYAADSM